MKTRNTPGAGRPAGETTSDRAQDATPLGLAPSKREQLGPKEGELWLCALLLLVLLAAALALLSWDRIRGLPQRLEALPIGLVVLVALFGAYTWSKTCEIAELRGLLRGFEQRAAAAPPSEKQLEQIFALISRSQQHYRDLIDTFQDLLLALSLTGEIRAANRSFAELLDLPFSEIIGHKLDEFLDTPEGSGRQAAEKGLPRLLQRCHWSGVLRVRLRKGGEVRYFDCMFHVMVKDDCVLGLSVLARDITKQRESEARFTELFETLQEGVYFTTPEGQLLDANPALVCMLGYTGKEELLAVNVTDLFLDAAQRIAELEELGRQGTVRSREITLRRKDGTPVTCLDTASAIRDPSGRVTRYQGTLVDITQRRQMEKQLHAEQEFARRLVDSFPDLIIVLDTQAHYTFVSPRIQESLGYEPEELLGQGLGERTHPEDRSALLDLFNELIAGKRSHGIVEYRMEHKQSHWRLFRASASPLFDAQGKIAGVIASSRDITEVERLEQQLIQSEKLAAMGQMIAGVAHELNNPLTAILGASELLRERAADDATTRRQLDLTYRQARRAAHIVQNLLAFSRPAASGKARLQLSDLLHRTLQLHEHSLRANNIIVDYMPAPDIPAIVGDANQLIQVFLNLITNAEQAIRGERERGVLQVHVRSAKDTVSVVFQDDGPGIPREVLPRIFDPFFTTKRPGGGTGLGLSICMAIVREHGGNIEAQSRPEGGAMFTVSLPADKLAIPPRTPAGNERGTAALSPGSATRHPEVVAQNASPLQGRWILVVDDEESILELVEEGLSARGVIVDCAATGQQALTLATGRTYDAVLCDLHLANSGQSVISGREIFERLSGGPEGNKPLFFFMTGDLMESSARESLCRNRARLIQKPFPISELVALLSEALQTADRELPQQRVPE